MKLVVLVISVTAFASAAATFSREYSVAHFARSSVLSAFEGLASGSGTPEIPMSSRSMRELFETCAAVQQGAIYTLQTSATRADVDASCARLARTTLERNPTFGAAHTILMLSSNSAPQIAESLVLSQITAPLESWHAKLRLTKALSLYGTGYAALDRALGLDVGFMAQSGAGRAWLARLYRSQPDVRATLTALVGQSPNNVQSGFLNEVRRLDRD